MNDTNCNGWSNYPTWTVSMLMGNTESLYHFSKNLTQEIIANYKDETERVCKLADNIEALVDNLKPKRVNDIWNQLMTYAAGKVNYREIAQQMIDDYISESF